MTEKQNRFASIYASGTPVREAVVLAGYSEKNLSKTVAKLLADEEVTAYVEEIKSAEKLKNVLSRRQCREVLSKIALDPESSPNEKIKAVGMLIDFDTDADESNDKTIVFQLDFTGDSDNEN